MPYRAGMRHDQIALQLYTVRHEAAADLPGTLRAVAAAGYQNVEVAGLPDTEPDVLASFMRDAGLAVVAAHEGIDRLREAPDAVADGLAAIGCPKVVVPWMPEADRTTADDVRRFAVELGILADRFAERGMRFGYHNHSFEFAPLDGTTIWDILLTDLPRTVDLELDVYWAANGGRDPVELIQAAGPRVRTMHMKDRSAAPGHADVPAGQGTLDFPTIVAAGRDAGVEWYIAEQDDATAPLDDIASAFGYLTSLAT